MSERAELRILVVDDDPDIARLLGALLARHGFSQVRYVTSAEEALAAADAADLVLLDHQLPDSEGVALLRSLRTRPSQPGIVMITAHGNEALAAEALRRGADDYLVKDASLPHLLPEVLERVRRERALRLSLQEAEDELVRTERLAAIGEMMVTLRHEINNPLMSASAETDLLLSGRDPLTAAQRTSLEAVRDAVARIAELLARVAALRDTRATAYPGKLQMIALEDGAPAPAAAVMAGQALLYLPDDALARVATMVLRQAGWRVQRCATAEALAAAARAPGISLVAHAVTREHPGGALPASPERDYRVLAFIGEDVAPGAADADLAVRMPFDPKALATELERLRGG